jgi:hypothetical protein
VNAQTEQRLWNYLKDVADGDTDRTVRVANHAGNALPTSEETAGQLVREWRNRGLVTESASGRYATLTEEGVETEVVVDREELTVVADEYLPTA